jgi:hypothetical protein
VIPLRSSGQFDPTVLCCIVGLTEARHFGHTFTARQAPRHVVLQRGYLCHLWQ